MKTKLVVSALTVMAFLGLLYLNWGTFLGPEPPLPDATAIREAFTARGGEKEATDIARLWAADAFLDCIRIAYSEGTNDAGPALMLDGRAVPPNGWVYRFVSPSRGKELWVTLRPDGKCQTEVQRRPVFSDSRPLPSEILDSPAALEIAESRFARSCRGESRQITQMYAQVTTSPALFGEPRDPSPNRPTWQVTYIVRNDQEPRADLYLNLDAVTGDVLTAMEFSGGGRRVLFNKHRTSDE